MEGGFPMLEKITEKFVDVFRGIGGKASISEKNVEDAVEQIKMALLEADVNLRVVRRFVNSTLEEARGEKVLRSVSPGQQFIKIVHDKMAALLGDENQDLALKGTDTQSVILLLGLQGSGKTTTAAKLAYRLKGKGRKVLLVACDLVTTCFSHCSLDYAFLSSLSPDPLGAVLFLMTTPESRAFLSEYAGLAVPDGVEQGLGLVARDPAEVLPLMDALLTPGGRREYHEASLLLPRGADIQVIVDAVLEAGHRHAGEAQS